MDARCFTSSEHLRNVPCNSSARCRSVENHAQLLAESGDRHKLQRSRKNTTVTTVALCSVLRSRPTSAALVFWEPTHVVRNDIATSASTKADRGQPANKKYYGERLRHYNRQSADLATGERARPNVEIHLRSAPRLCCGRRGERGKPQPNYCDQAANFQANHELLPIEW